MSNDSIADLLTRIRNAQSVGQKIVKIRSSRMAESVLAILKSEGFIDSFETKPDGDTGFEAISVSLRYYESGDPLIKIAKRVSKSGRRVYARSTEIPKVTGGLGISIISTSQGVMSDREARRKKIGGEVLALVG